MDPQQETSFLLDENVASPLEDTVKTWEVSGKELQGWEKRAQECRNSLRPATLAQVAKHWSASEESLSNLWMGFDVYAVTFPMKNASGKIIGMRMRPLKDLSEKRACKDGANGLFIPEGTRPGDVDLILEGESDTAVGLTLGFGAIGLPGAGQCADMAAQFLAQCPVACPAIIADADAAGEQGAEGTAECLLAAGVACRVLVVPGAFGDLREWYQKGGLTSEELAKAIEAEEVRYPPGRTPGFFQVPNYLLRGALVARIGVGPWALLCALRSFTGRSGECFPGRGELAELLGVSTRTVDKWKGELLGEGLIHCRRGHTRRTNEYMINFGPCEKMTGKHPARSGFTPRRNNKRNPKDT